jgi:predicted amidophosphoribosyltransferase
MSLNHNETWQEDHCCSCLRNDTDFLQDICDECLEKIKDRQKDGSLDYMIESFFGYSLD